MRIEMQLVMSLFICALAAFVLSCPRESFTSFEPITGGGTYGSDAAMDGLANQAVEDTLNGVNRTSFRFRARYSGPLTDVTWMQPGTSGYCSGKGAAWAIELFADDETANHFPTGAALASTTQVQGCIQNITSVSRAGSGCPRAQPCVVTVTLTNDSGNPHNLLSGYAINISQVEDPSFNGNFTICAPPTSGCSNPTFNTFTYQQAASAPASSTGGLVTYGTYQNWPTTTFRSPATLTQGTIYHLVWRNTDAAPTTNWGSVDYMFRGNYTILNNPYPVRPHSDWAGLWRASPGGAWNDLTTSTASYVPIADLHIGSFHDGVGYVENGNTDVNVSGNTQARERFTVSGRNRIVTSINIYTRLSAGTGALTATLESSTGTAIDRCSIAASAFGRPPTNPSYQSCRFTTAQTLVLGTTYNIRFSAPAGTTYVFNAVLDGQKAGAGTWATATRFTDGRAEFTTGGAWTGWNNSRQTNTSYMDLQFYFALR